MTSILFFFMFLFFDFYIGGIVVGSTSITFESIDTNLLLSQQVAITNFLANNVVAVLAAGVVGAIGSIVCSFAIAWNIWRTS